MSLEFNPNLTFTEVRLASSWGKFANIRNGEDFGNNGGFSIEWNAVSVGCGHFEIYIDKNGALRSDSQLMGNEFMISALAKLLEGARDEVYK